MPDWIIPALIFIGLVLIYVEFFLPGGILAVLGAISLIAGIVLIFLNHGPLWGLVSTFAIALIVLFLIRYWMVTFHRSYLGRKITLQTEIGDDEYLSSLPSLVGKRGRTTTEVHPSGKALIEGRKYDVVALIGTIPDDTEIEVEAVDGIRIVVRSI